MPTVLRVGPYRFHFYSAKRNEPAHIHVARDDFEAKFWLSPVALARNDGLGANDIREVQRLVVEHCDTLLRAYIAYHGH